jgi:preprotein translocase subunit SecA
MTRLAVAPYAERHGKSPRPFDLWTTSVWGGLEARWPVGGITTFAKHVRSEALRYEPMSDPALLAAAAALRPALLQHPARLQPRVFGLAHAAVQRHMGMRYHAVQLAGGRLLTRRAVAEMATGEGKTITAILPAVAAALAGQAVHIVTVNDYLARRDAERLRPVFGALGLSVGLVQEGDDLQKRREAYRADITYVTNKELVFDYLKDRIATTRNRSGARQALSAALGEPRSGLLLRGLQVAIVDEADSVLIDEARTPLIISEDKTDHTLLAVLDQALDVASRMDRGQDFALDETRQALHLMPPGQEIVAEQLTEGEGLFRARYAREQIIVQALTALHLFQRDRHYIVRDGAVQIVDEYTGRVMPDRSWEQGLHQLVEAKEGLPPTGTRTTLARITYQRYFNRYLRLSGMTGTAREVAGELRAVYGLRVMRLPPNRKLRRDYEGARLLPSAARKWQAVTERAAGLAGEGRPVLIGTQSVADSEALASVMTERNVPHVLLNARQDAHEAAVVAEAGQAGRITVATNMAGRGTDIVLEHVVAAKGGLHVILTEYSDSQRIDRQLYGRAGRQGDPGSSQDIVALDDALFRRVANRPVRAAFRFLPGWLALRLLRFYAQRAATRSNAQQRRRQVMADENADRLMGYAGRE